MTKILAQHGYGKGQKITNGLNARYLNGAIFSQSAENIESITHYVQGNSNLDKNNVFIDPQFYYSTFEQQLSKKIENNPNFPFNITRKDWRTKSEPIVNYIDYHVDQTKEISNTLITPGFYIEHIDWKFDYSVDIYNYCVNKYNADFENFAMSLLVHNSIFSNKINVQEFVEELIEVNHKDYIYFTIVHDKNNDSNYEDMDQNVLGNILYALYLLRENGFKIIVGYTFMNSLLFAMLDCEYVSTGWYNTLRKFQSDVFSLDESFGTRKKRYTSIPLLSAIMFQDIDSMINSDKITFEDILSKTRYDVAVVSGEENVSLVDLEHQYWESIQNGIAMFDGMNSISDRISLMKAKISAAIQIYENVINELKVNGRAVEAKRIQTASKHLSTWLNAIDIFASDASIL